MKQLSNLVVILSMLVVANPPAHGELLSSTGKIDYLRIHEIGTGYGPPWDFLDAEVVVRLKGWQPDRVVGFQLRNDGNLPVRQGMLNFLRDAFTHGWTIIVVYDRLFGSNKGVIVRLAVNKP